MSRDPAPVFVVVLALAALAVAHIGLRSDVHAANAPHDVASPGTAPVDDACLNTDATRWGEAGTASQAPFAFFRNGLVFLRVCTPGTLEVRARGTEIRGVGANLVVALGTLRLADHRVVGATTLEIVVPHAGWLALGFVNRDVGAEGRRSLWIDRVTFASPQH